MTLSTMLLDRKSTLGLLTLEVATARLHRAANTLGADRVELGCSREGRPIEMFRFGAGAMRSFWYGGPHANEPVGVSTIIELVERLVVHPEVLSGEVGFDIVLCIDPDGYVRNENWFGPTVDIDAYYRGFFRQPLGEMPDWDLPVNYSSNSGALRRQSALPEGQALQVGLELSRPRVLYALHNAELGGFHFYVRAASEQLSARLSEVPASFGLPREEGTLDNPGAQPLSPGVFALPALSESFEDILRSDHAEPSSQLHFGASAAEWCDMYGTTSVVPEVPLWSATKERHADNVTLGDLSYETSTTLARFAVWLADAVDTHSRFLLDSDPKARSVRDAVGLFTRLSESLALWSRSERTIDADAVTRNTVMLELCLPQRFLGMLLAATTEAGASSAALSSVDAAFNDGMNKLKAANIIAHPIPTLVDAQLNVGLLTTELCTQGTAHSSM
ncbi:M14 family zinc carboxypeptidase [Rhodococcus qingshengii]